MRSSLILFLLVAVQAAWAQEPVETPSAPPPPDLAPPLVQAPPEPEPSSSVFSTSEGSTALSPLVLERGDRVRVGTTQGQLSGELVSLMPGALSLKEDPDRVRTLLLSDVQELELRKRSPWQGALVGGGVGGVSGGLLFALLCVAVAEGDSGGIAAPCAAIGAVVGGAFGAGVGTLIGLALPRWATQYEREQGPLSLQLEEPEEGSPSEWFSGKGLVGELGFQAGYVRDVGLGSSDGWGGRLHLLALLGPYLAVGPEVAWYSHVGSETILSPGGAFQENRSLFQLEGLVRVGAEIGPTRTSALLGLGFHHNRTDHVGASAGGEVEVDLLEKVPPLAIEVRYHFDVDRDEFEPVQQFLTFGLGTRLRW